MVNIKGLDKSEVLLALWMRSKMQGISFLGYGGELTLDEAKEIVSGGNLDFDYLNGKIMKVDISGDEFDERLYDRDNGDGAAQRAINTLREKGVETFVSGDEKEICARNTQKTLFAMLLQGLGS